MAETLTNDVMISGIIPRRDHLNRKGIEVNNLLKTLCTNKNMFFIDNALNIYNDLHLNGSGVHLNENGTIRLANNFLGAIKL